MSHARSSDALRACFLAALLLLAGHWSVGQEPPPPSDEKSAFASEVEIVTVDAVVVDKDGHPVPGLTKDDFEIKDDGELQAITSFEAVAVKEAAPAAAEPRREIVSTNVVPETRYGRTFVVVFDDIHLSPLQAQRARGVVAAFLESGVADGDRVVLVATGGGAWWNAEMPEGRGTLIAILKRLDGRYVPDPSPDRITEYEAMRIEVHQDEQMAWKVMRRFDAYGAVGREKDPRGVRPPDAVSSAPGMIPEIVRMRAREVYELSVSRNKITMRLLERAIEALGGIKGRKAMILVSQGFIYDLQLGEMKDVVEASRRANVPIYFIDTRGLQALPEAFTASFGRPLEIQDTVAVLADMTREAEGAEALALDTGGFVVKNSNDLAGGINRVSDESRVYYLLGYNPGPIPRDGRFRKIEVKLRDGKGLKVRARRGYYAPLDGEKRKEPPTSDDPLVVHALDAPYEIDAVPLRVSSFVFDEVILNRIGVTLGVDIDIRDLDFETVGLQSIDALAFVIEVQHRETGEYYRYDQKIEMSLQPETRERLERTWYAVAREFTLPPGGYQAKVVVRDLNSGNVGSVIHDFEVPASGDFRVSTPVLSDVLDRDPDGSPRPVLKVRRAFTPGAVLYCQFSVYGAERADDGSLMPQVSAGYEIRRHDGTVFKRGKPTLINPTSLGALLRLNGISLQGARPGDYELVLTVHDDLAGHTLEVREPFVIEAG